MVKHQVLVGHARPDPVGLAHVMQFGSALKCVTVFLSAIAECLGAVPWTYERLVLLLLVDLALLEAARCATLLGQFVASFGKDGPRGERLKHYLELYTLALTVVLKAFRAGNVGKIERVGCTFADHRLVMAFWVR